MYRFSFILTYFDLINRYMYHIISLLSFRTSVYSENPDQHAASGLHMVVSVDSVHLRPLKQNWLPKKIDSTAEHTLPCPYSSSLSHLLVISPACSRVRYRRPSVRPSVRLSTFMSTFDIYVKVSILINYKTKQPSNLAWNVSLTSWLYDIGVRFSVCLSIRPSVCQHLCRSSTFMSKLVF